MKIAVKISKLILISLFIIQTSAAKTTIYKYRLYQRIENDTLGSLFGMEQEFFTQRKYFSSSIFSETRLLTGDTHKSLTYKIDKSVWYYKVNNQWKLFYNFEKKKGGYFSQDGYSNKIIFKRELKIRGVVLHEITFEPIGKVGIYWQNFYFTPEKGVLIIERDGIILLRTDFFKSELTENELESIFDFK